MHRLLRCGESVMLLQPLDHARQITWLPFLHRSFEPLSFDFTGALHRNNDWERQLPFGEIRAQRFACFGFAAEQVEAIVVNLVSRADGQTELSECRPLDGVCLA